MSILFGEAFIELNPNHSPDGRGGGSRSQQRRIKWPTANAKDRVIDEIKALPDSAIRTALLKTVVPDLTEKPQFTRTIAGIDLPVTTVNVGFQYKPIGQEGHGHFSYTGDRPRITHIVESDQKVTIPVVIGVTDEVRSFLPNSFLPDGTLVADMSFSKGTRLLMGLAPQIVIVRSTNLDPANLAEVLDLERFSFIKEACSWLIDHTLLEETIKKMRQQAMKSTLLVRDIATDNVTEVEMGINAINKIKNTLGRTQALTDLAPYLLALQAIRGTAYYDRVAAVKNIGPVIEEVGNIDYGDSAAYLLYNSTSKVLALNSVYNLHYIGRLRKIP